MPGEGLTHGPPVERIQAAVTTGSAKSSGIPCAMAYGLYMISPGTGSLAPVGRELVEFATLISAPGYQDHTTSPSANASFVREIIATTRSRPPHLQPNARDDREAPLSSGRDGRDCELDLPDEESANRVRQSNPTGSHTGGHTCAGHRVLLCKLSRHTLPSSRRKSGPIATGFDELDGTNHVPVLDITRYGSRLKAGTTVE